ncbi:hypothetical protein [Luteolibacter sp. LG18]|uniref:hypothetical protein n=1 Tax=Luteolibacter sp. LG18 TaxID=2819286 RepID=UPI002B3101E7|nr:hypothetical protein llg_02480 [Luteolibacter sp. LG18]
MKRLTLHILAIFLCSVVFAPIWVAGRNVWVFVGDPQSPMLDVSLFVAGLLMLLFSVTVLAPVASISVYLNEHRFDFPVWLEPAVVIGILAVYLAPVAWLVGRSWLPAYLGLLLFLVLPVLLYWAMLRAGFLDRYEV